MPVELGIVGVLNHSLQVCDGSSVRSHGVWICLYGAARVKEAYGVLDTDNVGRQFHIPAALPAGKYP